MIARGVNPGSMRDIRPFFRMSPLPAPRTDGSWGWEGGLKQIILLLSWIYPGVALLTPHKMAEPFYGFPELHPALSTVVPTAL